MLCCILKAQKQTTVCDSEGIPESPCGVAAIFQPVHAVSGSSSHMVLVVLEPVLAQPDRSICNLSCHNLSVVLALKSAPLAAGRGVLTYLQWNDMTCNTCGGRSSARCIQATTGADAQRSCGSECKCLLLGHALPFGSQSAAIGGHTY